jgi:hypothetical protein
MSPGHLRAYFPLVHFLRIRTFYIIVAVPHVVVRGYTGATDASQTTRNPVLFDRSRYPTLIPCVAIVQSQLCTDLIEVIEDDLS